MSYKYINLSIDELQERGEESCQNEAGNGTLNSKKATGKEPKDRSYIRE